MTFKDIAKDLIFPFFFGGLIFAAVKYSSTHLNNPALASILAAFPLGLLSAYLIKTNQIHDFSKDYFVVTLSLATAIAVLYALVTYTKIDKTVAWLISLGVWLVLVVGRYLLFQRKSNKE